MRNQGMPYHLAALLAGTAAFLLTSLALIQGHSPFYVGDSTAYMPLNLWEFAGLVIAIYMTGYCVCARKYAPLLSLEERDLADNRRMIGAGLWGACIAFGLLSSLVPVGVTIGALMFSATHAIVVGMALQVIVVTVVLRVALQFTMRWASRNPPEGETLAKS